MGWWMSRLGDGSRITTLQENLFASGLKEDLENSLGVREAHISGNAPKAEAATTPILHYPADATVEPSDSGGKEFEGQQLQMSNYLSAGSGSPSALRQQVGDVPRSDEQPRNISSDSPSSTDDEIHQKELKSDEKFAYWSGSISFTGVMGIIGARVGNLALKKLPLFVCSASTCSAFIISMLLLIFTTICPPPKNSRRIIRGTQCLIVGLINLAVGFGFAMIF